MPDASETSLGWSELVPGGVVIYYADGDEEIQHVNQYVLDMFECDDYADFMSLTGGSFRGFVDSPDVASAEDSIWGQVSERNGLDHIYYQIRTKTGKSVAVDDYGRLVRRPGERPVFYVFVVEMDRGDVIDWLTGLPGIERFVYVAGMESRSLLEHGNTPVVLSFDLMGMKSYNALNGREAGDRLLRSFATTLRQSFGTELCCRYSGDSFCALAPLDKAETLARQVFGEFAAREGVDGLPVMAGACAQGPQDDVAMVLDRAKIACDSDRATWESHLSWFTDQMRDDSMLRTHVLEHVGVAIEQGWIQPFYQGIVRASTGRLCGFEALARWDDPRFGHLLPAQFVPTLDEAGLLIRLDLHMCESVLADLSRRMRLGQEVVPVSVNLSLSDIVQHDIAGELARRADAAGVPHDLLCVELAEPVATHAPDLLKAQIDALHEAGFEVWLDDFGRGVSTLNTLKAFDFDLIKMDMALITGGDSTRRAIILEGLVRSAKRLGVRLVAEGVETAGQAEELAELGCDMLQGFHYYLPSRLGGLGVSRSDCGKQAPEPADERRYWNAVGLVSLPDLVSHGEMAQAGQVPSGVVECRHGMWRMLRATQCMRAMLLERGIVSQEVSATRLAEEPVTFDAAFEAAIARCEASDTWELIAGPLEYGSGYQFHIAPLSSCAEARSYVLAGTPTQLGSALGIYGDVPVGYAVLCAVRNVQGGVCDVRFVYANALYSEWSGFGDGSLIGRRLMEAAPQDGRGWVDLCAHVIGHDEQVRGVVYSERAGHWLSYNVVPSLANDHCILAVALADAEQAERQELIEAGMHDPLTGLLNRRGIDEEIALRQERNPHEVIALVLLDVDDFKTINDLYGHDVGDQALRTLARKLTDVFPKTAVVGRNGGDEALVALFGDDALAVKAFMERLMRQDLSCELNGRRYALSLSAGYALSRDAGDLKRTYSRADVALYAVKLAGKSGYRAWSPKLEESPQRSLLGFTTRDLAEGMPLAMLAHRPDGTVLFANGGLARLLGNDVTGDALGPVGRSLSGIVCPRDWEALDHALSDMAAGTTTHDEIERELHVMARDGSEPRVTYRARLISSREKGELFYAYMVGRARR